MSIHTWQASIPRAFKSASSNQLNQTRQLSASGSMNSTIQEKKALRKQIQPVLRQLPPDALASQGAAVLRHLDHFGPFVSANRVGCYVSMASAELPTSTIIDSLVQANKKVFLPFVSFTDKNQDTLIGGIRSHKKSDVKRPAETQMDLLQFIPPSNYTSFSASNHLVPFKFSNSSPEIFQFDPAVVSGLPNALDVGLDLLLLPGVGFDKKGNRLGHGKGYYDRFITELMKKTREDTRTGEEEKEEESTEDQVVKQKLAKHSRPMLVGICLREQILLSVPCQSHDQPLDYLVSPDGVLSFSEHHH